VLSKDLVFKASEHKFKLKWTGGTTVVDANQHKINHAALKFKTFTDIVSGKWKPDILVRKYLLQVNL
jgi:hypothetical protein